MRLIFLFLCFYYIFGIKCENNDLSEDISNPVLFSNRKNYVLFIFYENTTITIEKFKTLLGTFIELEEEGDCKNNNKIATIRFPCSWKTFVQFGNGNETFPNLTSFEFDNSIGVNELMDNAEYLFNASKVQNPETLIDDLMNDIVSETTEFAIQRFVVVVSDQCFSDSLSSNPHFGTESLSMLMLQNDSKKCCNNWPIFNPENITASIQMYSNMDVQYSANPNTTVINFIAVIYKNETIFDFVLNFIKERILSKGSLCRNRKFIGAFQIGSNDKKSQKVFTMALPLYFNDDETEWYFEYNLRRAFNNAEVMDFNDETCFQSYLLNAKNGRDFNQTIIFYIDSIPPCINLNTFWNKTNVREILFD